MSAENAPPGAVGETSILPVLGRHTGRPAGVQHYDLRGNASGFLQQSRSFSGVQETVDMGCEYPIGRTGAEGKAESVASHHRNVRRLVVKSAQRSLALV